MHTRGFKVGAWVFLGTFLIQLAWALALPPFRGIDEFDHAYRAAAVAGGQWRAPGLPAENGRGELVRLPGAIVRDAGPVCSRLDYPGPDNCGAVTELADGNVTVASAAARYNPVFYWVVGTPSRLFEGAGALYAMRATAALITALAAGAAAGLTTLWSRTAWPAVAVVATLTPVMVYSLGLPAPNGIEMAAALGLWSSLLALGRARPEQHRLLLLSATAFALPVAGVRGLGPLWLACILLSWLVLLGPRRALEPLRRNRLVAAGCLGAGLLVAAASSWWTLGVGSMELEPAGPYSDPVANSAAKLPLWLLQSIAAFPTRGEAAPSAVYAAALLALTALCVAGWLRATRRSRLAAGVVLGLAVLVPLALQIATYTTAGPIWQGRYGWPLAMGLLLILGFSLDEAPPRHRLVRPVLVAGFALWAIAHTVSVVTVLNRELDESPLAGDARWITAPAPAVGLLALLGVLAWGLAARSSLPGGSIVGAGRPSGEVSRAVLR